MGTYALSDVLGWGLVGVLITSIAGSAVVRWIGLNRAWAWGLVVGYTGLIYATLSVAPELWGTAARWAGIFPALAVSVSGAVGMHPAKKNIQGAARRADLHMPQQTPALSPTFGGA